MKRKLFTTLVAAAILIGSAAAQPKVMSVPELGLVPGTVGGTLTLAIGSAPPSFFYYGQIDNAVQALTAQTFDPLIEFNLANYELEPALATSWSVSADGRTYTFQLREGVTWHDGTPFTAADVVFTFEQIITNPETRAGDSAQFIYTVEGEPRRVTFEAVGDHTVVFHLPAPSAAFLLNLRAFYMMPKHKLLPFSVEGGAAPSDINNAWPTTNPATDVVGTGPFMYDNYVAGQLVSLRRNPNYWKTDEAGTSLPYAANLEYLVVSGTEAQTAQFMAGNLDALNISGAQFPNFKEQEVAGAGFTVVVSNALFGSPPHVAFNFDDSALGAAFSSVAFRRAMEYAVDRWRVIDDVYNGLATLPGTPVAPANGAFYENTTSLMNMFDLEAANSSLDALGYLDSDGDGVRNLPGGGANLEFALTYASDSGVFTDIATILQNDFAQVGVKANLQAVLNAALLGTGLAGEYQAIIVALGNQPDPELRKPIWQPGGALYYWHRSTQPAGEGQPVNFAAMAPWEQQIYDIFDRGTTEVDPEVRAANYRVWQVLNAVNVPVIMIAKPSNIAAVYDHVGNFVYNLGVIPGYNPVPLYYVQ